MMWNVDSMDWADPVPKSIAERVLAEVDKAQRGIILFHDIHGRAAQALPTVLDQLVADGYRFATWRDGQVRRQRTQTRVGKTPACRELPATRCTARATRS